MNSLQFFFENAWRWKFDLPELEEEYHDANEYNSVPDIEEIEKLQFNTEFVRLMNDRMVQGYFRYGNRHKRRATYDHIISILSRLAKYKKTGNTELLVDAANILRMEFEIPQHPKAHFKSLNDEEHFHNIKK